jgi:glycogen debranching enzyme
VGSKSTTTIFSGYTVLCSSPDGSVSTDPEGLFHEDARVLSRYELTIGGSRPELVSTAMPENDRWEAVLRFPRPGGGPEGPMLPQDALEIRRRRLVGPGMLESIEVRNHSAVPCETTFEVELDADFADVAEVGRKREQQGVIDRRPDPDGGALEVRYAAERDERRTVRGLRVAVVSATTPPEVSERQLAFELRLEPRGEWRALLSFGPLDGGEWRAPESLEATDRSRQRAAWRARRPVIECVPELQRPFERAADDLFDLRNWELERRLLGSVAGAEWIVNAGVPTFTGLFGRDVLTAGWQSTLLGTRATRGALAAVAATQATADDPWRDGQPGKLIHELRSGPMSELGLIPRDAYYGTHTTPAMFLLALSELWHWTGDLAALARHRDVAVRAMEWAIGAGDPDGDGFLEYERRSPRGLRNQGWKDSDEAIRHSDGSIVNGPVATVEEQAFLYIALERMAEILVALGEDERADDYLRRANRFRERWHDAYWMPEEQFYALALDGSKQQVRSITSNPGHALGAGLVPRNVARTVADRLLAPDLFSGWGVRTLSNTHPSYNPFAYHLGAVWPVEQATFALGFKRYGLDEHLDRLVEGVLSAAFEADDARLPEALSGQPRSEVPMPVPYPDARSPQAWSASALVQLVQIMLGLYPFAALNVLAVVRPRLPVWLPQVTLRRIRVGAGAVDLRFDRRPDGSASWRVLDSHGRLVVVPAGAPDDVAGGNLFERIEIELLRRMPGRRAEAGRIALGLWKSG